MAYDHLGDARRAIEFYEQDLTIAREVGDRRGEGITLGNLGMAYAELGEMQLSVELLCRRLAITRETGDRRAEVTVLWNLSQVLDKLSKRNEAIVYAELALEIYRQIEHLDIDKVHTQLVEWKRLG